MPPSIGSHWLLIFTYSNNCRAIAHELVSSISWLFKRFIWTEICTNGVFKKRHDRYNGPLGLYANYMYVLLSRSSIVYMFSDFEIPKLVVFFSLMFISLSTMRKWNQNIADMIEGKSHNTLCTKWWIFTRGWRFSLHGVVLRKKT